MNPYTYHKEAMRTKVNLNSAQQLANAALGLAGEYSEIILDIRDDKDILLECGDFVWYCADACDALNMSLGEIFPEENDCSLFVPAVNIGCIADIAKKVLFHGLEIKTKQRVYILDAVHDLIKWVRETLLPFGYTLDDCMDANILKLYERYPDGFVQKGK